mgnify:CR=1 FL=1
MLTDFYIRRLSDDIEYHIRKIIEGVKFCIEVVLKKRRKYIKPKAHNIFELSDRYRSEVVRMD